MGAPAGNKNATKNRLWTDALNRALLADDGKKLRSLADKLISRAEEGDVTALKEIGDRMEGKPAQSVILAGELGITQRASDLSDDALAEIVNANRQN